MADGMSDGNGERRGQNQLMRWRYEIIFLDALVLPFLHILLLAILYRSMISNNFRA